MRISDQAVKLWRDAEAVRIAELTVAAVPGWWADGANIFDDSMVKGTMLVGYSGGKWAIDQNEIVFAAVFADDRDLEYLGTELARRLQFELDAAVHAWQFGPPTSAAFGPADL
jgi:hypothetical protein